MRREEALELIRERVGSKNLIKHMLAAEACMRKLARLLGENPDVWGAAGLLHDIDYEETSSKPELHGIVSSAFLEEIGVEEAITGAVKAHARRKERTRNIEKALYAVDPATGLIVAAALMHPAKKIKSLDTGFVLKRFREKRFAAGADRGQIAACSEIGLDLETFIGVCLEAMKEIDTCLGL